ncbi:MULTISPECIES: hypothetical protein [Paraburkholderia]|uniref:Uncharacterized protein n=1 Tax=Paraburkholderia tropica TaxID=92647 RepID=A0A1A5XCL2_9BURK|nr:hypothetical protein [Paraburkholderia tropica]MBB2981849.1 hypothetical protein [Paraburkholderia tropica]MBB3003617.1 hypothetical protein [Paraburkholderia tropica]MBB6322474.1 hypothetical protein [Paraburkholderia tropica]MDE1143964.1 hypothetical protein [Paraburkholderia tropica]OBR51236.1 hypothetical protein A6456_14610 [Paraburkholderia tropica]
MNRIFMTREEVIHLLLEAHATARGGSAPTLIKPVGRDPAKVEALDRLLLDVRAGRVNEIRLDANDSTHIAITD